MKSSIKDINLSEQETELFKLTYKNTVKNLTTDKLDKLV